MNIPVYDKVIEPLVGILSGTQPTWHHLMTVNPMDGLKTFYFEKDIWHRDQEQIGQSYRQADYFSPSIAKKAVHKIRIETVLPGTGKYTEKEYTLKPDYKGKSFYWLMQNSYNTRITDPAYSNKNHEEVFNCDPLAHSSSSGLMFNWVSDDKGVRIVDHLPSGLGSGQKLLTDQFNSSSYMVNAAGTQVAFENGQSQKYGAETTVANRINNVGIYIDWGQGIDKGSDITFGMETEDCDMEGFIHYILIQTVDTGGGGGGNPTNTSNGGKNSHLITDIDTSYCRDHPMNSMLEVLLKAVDEGFGFFALLWCQIISGRWWLPVVWFTFE